MRSVNQGHGKVRILGIGAGALAFAGLMGSASAVELGADDEIRYVQRDLVMPEMTLTPFADLRIINYDGFITGTEYTQNMGARFVPLENLEIHFNPMSFYAGDASGYGTVQLGAVYRFVNEDVIEIGGALSLPVGQTGPIDFIGIQAGLPVRIHGGDFFRLDTGFFFSALFDTSVAPNARFSLAQMDDTMWPNADPMLPVEMSFQIIDELFAGFDTGVGILDVADAGDRVFVPLGMRFGGTVPMDGRPFVDLTTGFRWPAFLSTFGPDAAEPGFIEIQLVRAEFHIDVGG